MAIEVGKGPEPLRGPKLPGKTALIAAGTGVVLAAAGGAAYASGVFNSDGPANPEAETYDPSLGNQPDLIPGTEIPNPLKTPTVEPTPTVAPTATPEKKADVPCNILPIEFCSTGERVAFVLNEKTYTYIGFNPPPGTPIFSTTNGLLIKAVEGGNPFSGFLGRLEDDAHSRVYAYRGDIVFDDMLQKNVKAGDKIGVIGNSGVKNLGDYSLVVTSTKIPSSVTDEELQEKLFPSAYNKPISGAITPEGEIKPTVTISYSSEPPVGK